MTKIIKTKTNKHNHGKQKLKKKNKKNLCKKQENTYKQKLKI